MRVVKLLLLVFAAAACVCCACAPAAAQEPCGAFELDERGDLHVAVSNTTGTTNQQPQQARVFVDGVDVAGLQERIAQQKKRLQRYTAQAGVLERACRFQYPPLVDETSIMGVRDGVARFHGGVFAHGSVFGIPAYVDYVLVIDTATHALSYFNIPFTNTGDYKFAGGVLAASGDAIYGIPSYSNIVLKIDAVARAAVSNWPGLNVGHGVNKWAGGALGPNGLIYGVPYTSTSVLIIDPATDTVDTTSIAGLSGDAKWTDAATATDGRIFCMPFSKGTVLVIDPFTHMTRELPVPNSRAQAYRGAVIAGNGLIFGIPFKETSALVVNPFDDTLDKLALPEVPGQLKFIGGVVAPNGHVLAIPLDTSQPVLSIDPLTMAVDNKTLAMQTPSSEFMFRGAAVADNGFVYIMPSYATFVPIVDVGC